MPSISSLLEQTPLMSLLNRNEDAGVAQPRSPMADTLRPVEEVSGLPSQLSSGLSSQARLLSESFYYASQYEQKNTGSIEILTQDGDRVQLSFSSQLESMIEKNFRQDASGQASSVLQRQSTRMTFQMSVQGELDKGEMQALDSLLRDLGKLASRFYQGDLQAAMQAAMKLELDASELQRFSVELSQSSHLEVVEQYQKQALMTPEVQSSRGPSPLVELFSELQEWLQEFKDHSRLQAPIDAGERLMKQMLSPLEQQLGDEQNAYLSQLLDQLFSDNA